MCHEREHSSLGARWVGARTIRRSMLKANVPYLVVHWFPTYFFLSFPYPFITFTWLNWSWNALLDMKYYFGMLYCMLMNAWLEMFVLKLFWMDSIHWAFKTHTRYVIYFDVQSWFSYCKKREGFCKGLGQRCCFPFSSYLMLMFQT